MQVALARFRVEVTVEKQLDKAEHARERARSSCETVAMSSALR
jgi:hypothetical protein